MKSDRRHELEKNELADRLASGIESTRSYLPQILGLLGVLLVLSIGWGIYSSYSKQQASDAWTEFYFNLTRAEADSFMDVAQGHPGTAAAGWARQIAGDNYLQRGIGALYRDRAEAKDLIGKAIEAFEEVDREASNPDLRNKALLGLAQAYESLGDVEKASNYYQQFGKTASNPALAAEANERLAFLASKSGKEFYAWFNQLEPKQDAPITLPADMTTPPTIPDLEFGPAPGAGNTSGLPAVGEVPAVIEVPLEPAEGTGASPASPAAEGGSPAPAADTPAPAAPAATEVPAPAETSAPAAASAEAPAAADSGSSGLQLESRP